MSKKELSLLLFLGFVLIISGCTQLSNVILVPPNNTAVIVPSNYTAVMVPSTHTAVIVPPNNTAVIVPIIDFMPAVPQVIFIGITTVKPLDLATQRNISNNIIVTFDEAMIHESVNENTFIIRESDTTGVTGVITSDATKKIWTFNPQSSLKSNMLYTVIITQEAKGVSGNSLIEDFVWSFTTSPESSVEPSYIPSYISSSSPALSPVLTTITLSPAVSNIIAGSALQLTAAGLDQYNSSINATIIYTTSNSSVATVSPLGVVTGAGAGTATITATSGEIGAASIITVTPPINPNSTTLNWTDYGPIFRLGPQKAYYPSVQKINGVYNMWYGSGDNANLGYANSTDGINWTEQGDVNGSSAYIYYHAKVLFDENKFGNTTGHKYKIWFWNYPVSVYSLAIKYAESDDGINWINVQSITQDSNFLVYPLSTGTGCGNPFCGTYGPFEVIYNSSASNSGSNPFSYSYVMYFDAYQGIPTQENTGLAYSSDGKRWTRYGSFPVLNAAGTGSGKWDSQYATASSVVHYGNAYNMWYSGGVLTNNEGIGYAISCNGINWVKVNENPLFNTTDGVLYRNGRAYTPVVIEDNGVYKMWYSCKGNATAYGGDSSDYALCYATANANPLLELCINYPAPPPVFTTITISPVLANIIAGSTSQLTAASFDQYNSPINATITYTTSNSSVATVNPLGVVTGVGAGTATIIARSGVIGAASIITVAAGCPSVSVNLGTSGNFAVLAKTLISDATPAASLISGNIGVHPAAGSYITDVSCTRVKGTIYDNNAGYAGGYDSNISCLVPNSGTLLGTAIGDMQTAYTAANGLAACITELGAGDISGLTLAPGVYKWGTGVLINSDVTLLGNATDVWVFQISQTLDITSGKQVKLAGGAIANNVYWVVAGQTTLGTTSVLNGNLLDMTSIAIQTNAVLNGRALAQAAIVLDSNNITKPN